MTSTVSPVGTDPASDGVPPNERSGVAPAPKGRIRRIAEEEHILVVLLAGFGLIFLLIFPPALLVNDSWLNLMTGREVIENGLPRVDELTIYGLGSTWTDQQWGAQVFMYGVYSLGGFALLSIMACVFVVGAFTLAAAASRSLGAARGRSGCSSSPSSSPRRSAGRSARPTPSTPNARTSRASSWRTWAPPRGSSLRSASAVLPPPCSTTSVRCAERPAHAASNACR